MVGRSRGHHTRRLLVVLTALLAALLANVSPVPPPPSARAATVTWDGDAFSDGWGQPNNWSPNGLPGPDDNVVFDGTSVRSNLLDQAFGINSLTINSGYGGMFSANPGVLLEITHGLTMARAASVTLPFEISATQSQTWQVPEIFGVLNVNGVVHLPTVLTVNSTGATVFNGAVVGPGASSLIKSGAGSLRLAGTDPNTYEGFTLVSAGTLVLDKAGAVAVPGVLFVGDNSGTDTVRLMRPQQIADSALVQIGTGGTLDLNDQDETIGSIAGPGSVDLGSGTLTVGGNGSSTVLSGPVTGTGGVTKVGSGTLQLTSANTYSGSTTITSGALELSGTPSGPVALTGGILVGTAQLGPITATGGTIQPGPISTFGSMSATSLDLAPGVTLDALIAGTTPDLYSQLFVSGPVKLDGATLSIPLGFPTPAGSRLAIITHTGSGPVSGTFANLPEGTAFLAFGVSGGTVYRISYAGGDGNDVVLTALGQACSPRPPVRLQSQVVGGKLQVTVLATPIVGGLSNPLASVTFSRLDNASVVMGGQGVSAGQTVQLAPNTASTMFSLARVTPGRASTVQLAATDTCGAWQTFVGGGPTAF